MSQLATDPSSVSRKQPKATCLKLPTQQILSNTLTCKISKTKRTEISDQNKERTKNGIDCFICLIVQRVRFRCVSLRQRSLCLCLLPVSVRLRVLLGCCVGCLHLLSVRPRLYV